MKTRDASTRCADLNSTPADHSYSHARKLIPLLLVLMLSATVGVRAQGNVLFQSYVKDPPVNFRILDCFGQPAEGGGKYVVQLWGAITGQPLAPLKGVRIDGGSTDLVFIQTPLTLAVGHFSGRSWSVDGIPAGVEAQFQVRVFEGVWGSWEQSPEWGRTASNIIPLALTSPPASPAVLAGLRDMSPCCILSLWIEIHDQPVSQTVACRGTARFSVTAYWNWSPPPHETNPPEYQWYFQGAPIPGATSRELTLTNVGFEQAGEYKVVLHGCGASAESDVARLTVESGPPPQLRIVREDKQVRVWWPASGCIEHALEETGSLSPPVWGPCTNAPVNLVGNEYVVDVPIERTIRFYRLRE